MALTPMESLTNTVPLWISSTVPAYLHITIFQYNYTHGNQGWFWLDCAGINKDSEYVKTVLRYNVSADDEKYIVRAGDMPTELYNNTFYKSEGKLDACFENEVQNINSGIIFLFPRYPRLGKFKI